MEYKETFAGLVRLAIEKGYEPEKIRDDFDGFERAFREFFGESFKVWYPRNCIRFENLIIRGNEIKSAEEVLVKRGIPAADAPAILQQIADVLLGNDLYI